MIDVKKLKAKIDNSGLSVSDVATILSIAPSTLYRKLENPDNFLICEVASIVDCLNLSNSEATDIFFASTVA